MKPRGIRPVRFRWIDWNRNKVLAHGLTTDDVEFAWLRGLRPLRRKRGRFVTFGRTPSGRLIGIVWKRHAEFDVLEPGLTREYVFVITAY